MEHTHSTPTQRFKTVNSVYTIMAMVFWNQSTLRSLQRITIHRTTLYYIGNTFYSEESLTPHPACKIDGYSCQLSTTAD